MPLGPSVINCQILEQNVDDEGNPTNLYKCLSPWGKLKGSIHTRNLIPAPWDSLTWSCYSGCEQKLITLSYAAKRQARIPLESNTFCRCEKGCQNKTCGCCKRGNPCSELCHGTGNTCLNMDDLDHGHPKNEEMDGDSVFSDDTFEGFSADELSDNELPAAADDAFENASDNASSASSNIDVMPSSSSSLPLPTPSQAPRAAPPAAAAQASTQYTAPAAAAAAPVTPATTADPPSSSPKGRGRRAKKPTKKVMERLPLGVQKRRAARALAGRQPKQQRTTR